MKSVKQKDTQKPFGIAPHLYLEEGTKMAKSLREDIKFGLDIELMLRNAGIVMDDRFMYFPLIVGGNLWVARTEGKGGDPKRDLFYLVLNKEAFDKHKGKNKVSLYEHFM